MEIFYVPDAAPDCGVLTIRGTTARHISRVLRHRPGDRVLATDGKGLELKLELMVVSPSRVEGRVLDRMTRPREPRCRVALAQALLKGDKLAQVVEAATELGVTEVIPFVSERTVARLGAVRQSRLTHVAVSGLETSARTVLPRISECVSLAGLLGRIADYECAVVAYEREHRSGVEDVLRVDVDSVLAIVGPEGGFSEDEICRLERAGAGVFSMGPRRLRAETAATAVVAICLQRLGDLG